MERSKKLLNNFKIYKSLIKHSELIYLNELLKSNISIKNALNLIKDKTNKKAIDSLILKLDQGSLIEEEISVYLPRDISLYMTYLLKTLTFSKSLDLSLSYYAKTKDNMTYLTKEIAYPLLLLFASISGLYLFNAYGFDSIIQMIKSFNIDTSAILLMKVVINLITNIFYFLMLFVLILFLYFKSDKRITIAYIWMCKYMPIDFLKMYFTEDFMSLYILTSNMGYKTKDTLKILKSLKNKPIVSLIAYHIDDRLLQGNNLMNAVNNDYVDHSLKKFINISSFAKNNLDILNSYVDYALNKIKTKMKFISTVVQSTSYLLIGVVIIFIYQILFMPMQALNMI